MKKILSLSLMLLSLHAVALERSEMVLKPAQNAAGLPAPKMELELDVFGLSYHTNRDYDFNETNPGVGLSFVMSSENKQTKWFNAGMVISAGTYEDSYYDQAYYFLAGPRLTLGYDDSFHVSVAGQAGYVKGSGCNGATVVPFVTVGYDWFNVGITADPIGRKGATSADESKMVAVFFKFRVLDF